MNWIVEIGKNYVRVKNDIGYKSYYEIKPGWRGGVDKVDDFLMAKVTSADKVIHLAMLPVTCTSVIWKNIDEAYKLYEQKNRF